MDDERWNLVYLQLTSLQEPQAPLTLTPTTCGPTKQALFPTLHSEYPLASGHINFHCYFGTVILPTQ